MLNYQRVLGAHLNSTFDAKDGTSSFPQRRHEPVRFVTDRGGISHQSLSVGFFPVVSPVDSASNNGYTKGF